MELQNISVNILVYFSYILAFPASPYTSGSLSRGLGIVLIHSCLFQIGGGELPLESIGRGRDAAEHLTMYRTVPNTKKWCHC